MPSLQRPKPLPHLQRLETLGHLSGGIAHDFANVLTVIIGSSELLLRTLSTPDERRDYARDILEAARRARGLTAALLAFSRIEWPQPVATDLNEVVGGMREVLHGAIGQDVELEFRLSPKLDSIRVLKAQIEQVLLNLVVNAVDAMPRGGRVTIETRFVTLTTAMGQRGTTIAPGRYVVLSVTDTGCGMTPEIRRRLFEPVFTTKATVDRGGFGLFICDTIVRHSGGLIFVDTEPDAGSVFTVLLPARAQADHGPALSTSSQEVEVRDAASASGVTRPRPARRPNSADGE